MALVPIKTASTTGYCDCIHGCYELASLRDEDTGKGVLPSLREGTSGNERGNRPAAAGAEQSLREYSGSPSATPHIPPSADPPGRLR